MVQLLSYYFLFVLALTTIQQVHSFASSPNSKSNLKVLFSDVDGALIHYPKSMDGLEDDPDYPILALPASATGLKGIISGTTLKLCRDLRQQGTKLVLISGMRTSTLLNRLAYLPRADAYCSEAGGRIFYPTTTMSDEDDEENDADFNPFEEYTPMEFAGAQPEDLKPFGLREDRGWRERMELEAAAGKDGYAGNEVFSDRCGEGMEDDDDEEECLIDYENMYGFPKQQNVIPVDERKGALWDFGRKLEQEGFLLDTKSYSTCFRVNQKHQTEPAKTKFEALLNGDIDHPSEIGKSTNLGCIDFYPVASGKRNW